MDIIDEETPNMNKYVFDIKNDTEELFNKDNNRLTAYPIKHQNIWGMYKKHIALFWTVEELDLSKDITDWNKLNANEQFFIKHILAFFAISDGLVNMNLGERFINDVELTEAKYFYRFQEMMEDIHCVTGDTKILTDKGYFEIKDLENQNVNIWNGEEFTDVIVKYTGNQAIYNVKLSNGMELNCTPGHKWLIQNGNIAEPNKIETINLKINDIIAPYNIPVVEFHNNENFLNPYTHGFFCGNGICDNEYSIIKINNITKLDITKNINKPKFFVPINHDLNDRLRWLEGLVDAIGYLSNDRTNIMLISNLPFLREVQLLLTTLGVLSNIKIYSTRKNEYVLYISSISKLIDIGFTPKKLKLEASDTINTEIYIKEIIKISDDEKTYCFNEPKKGTGIFNGILTCQSEAYSLLIETYIKDQEDKKKLFNAIENFESIKLKSQWAMKWINSDDEYGIRLVAFAIVEGVFFSGAFCSIFWLSERGLMPGLAQTNEFISRDEGLHVEFACLLFSKLKRKPKYEKIMEIFNEAVHIEKNFICESLPCKLLGMNSDLMCQYIEFVADRLLSSLGYGKIYNVSNPFPFMERISAEGKTNFFEKRVTQYQKASSTKNNDEGLTLTDDF